MQMWLTQYDRGDLNAALERKVGQLTMETDLLKKRRACVS